jgi:uncharacterized repeat protein (TIGR02543 family)
MLVVAMGSVACPPKDISTSESTYIVKFVTNGGSAVDDITVKQGTSIKNSPVTKRDGGFVFDCWYSDNSFENSIEFPFTPTENITLYADWVSVSSVLGAPLKAAPVAASTTSEPEVLEYLKSGNSNYYLVNVGVIHNMYISTIASLFYNGSTPMSWSKTVSSSTTITNALTETASKSVATTNTQGGKASLSFKSHGVDLGGEWTGSWGKTTSTHQSVETSFTEIRQTSDSETLSFTVGGNGEPTGYHRYALYGTADLYFIVETSTDKQTLKGLSSVVCVRDSSLFTKWDFSDGSGGGPNWDNSPVEEIVFPYGFHTRLAEPLPPDDKPTMPIESKFEAIRVATWEFNNKNQLDQKCDVIDISKVFQENLDGLHKRGYRNISFNIILDTYGIQWGHGRLYLYSSETKNKKYEIGVKEFNPDNGKWKRNFTLSFANIPIINFPDNKFVLRYNACHPSPFGSARWKNENLKIQIKIT